MGRGKGRDRSLAQYGLETGLSLGGAEQGKVGLSLEEGGEGWQERWSRDRFLPGTRPPPPPLLRGQNDIRD